MPKIHRPQLIYWLRDVLVPLFFYSLMLALLRLLNPDNLLLLVVFFAAGCVLIIRNTIVPVVQNRLQLDEHGISGRSFNERFEIPWANIEAAWTMDARNSTTLFLGAQQSVHEVPLKWLEVDKIWKDIRSHLPAEVLTPAARERLKNSITETQVQAQDRLLQSLPAPIKVGYSLKARVIGWGGIALFTLFAILTMQGDLIQALCFLPFILINALLVLLSHQTIIMDLEGVSDFSILGHYRIRWEEITQVKTDLVGTGMVFAGGARRLAVVGPAYWSGTDKELVFQFLAAQIRTRHIEVKLDRWMALKVILSWNTRVKKG